MLNPGVGKVYLCEDEDVLVTRYHIDRVVGRFQRAGVLGPDNATGVPGLLHRIGVMRDKVRKHETRGKTRTIFLPRKTSGFVPSPTAVVFLLRAGVKASSSPSFSIQDSTPFRSYGYDLMGNVSRLLVDRSLACTIPNL